VSHSCKPRWNDYLSAIKPIGWYVTESNSVTYVNSAIWPLPTYIAC